YMCGKYSLNHLKHCLTLCRVSFCHRLHRNGTFCARYHSAFAPVLFPEQSRSTRASIPCSRRRGIIRCSQLLTPPTSFRLSQLTNCTIGSITRCTNVPQISRQLAATAASAVRLRRSGDASPF